MYTAPMPKKNSDDELRRIYERIKPIVTVNGEQHWLRELSLEELKTPEPILCWNKKADKPVTEKLISFRTIQCNHPVRSKGGLIGFFPSISEVLERIMVEPYIVDVVAFEIVKNPDRKMMLRGNPLTSYVRLYRKET